MNQGICKLDVMISEKKEMMIRNGDLIFNSE